MREVSYLIFYIFENVLKLIDMTFFNDQKEKCHITKFLSFYSKHYRFAEKITEIPINGHQKMDVC